MSDELLVEHEGAVRVLTLNRPEARNALSSGLIRALYDALVAIDRDESVAAIVLTGTDPAFCAGIDLKEAAREGEAFFRRLHAANPIDQVAAIGKPVIGAVNGPAFTGGLELALSCDFIIASDRAVFADTHARVGVLPGSGLTVRLPLLVGPAQARRMSMTSDVVDADRAERIGLVTELVPHTQLRARALEIALSVADAPVSTMRALKRMYTEGTERIFGPSRQFADEFAAAHDSDLGNLERRRIAVQERNRAQLEDPRR